MKYFLTLFISAASLLYAIGQNSTRDSLIQLLEKAPNDTNRVKLLLDIASNYYFYKPDTSIAYSNMALQLARELNFKNGVFQSLSLIGESSRLLGDYPGAMKLQLEALEVSRKTKNFNGEMASLCFIGVIYIELKEYKQGLNYLLPANALSEKLPVNPLSVFILTNIGISYNFLNMPDSALYYLRQASIKNNDLNHPQLKSFIPINIGNVYVGMGKKDSALYYYSRGLQNSRSSNESINLGRAHQRIADLYFSERQYDSSIYYVRTAFTEAKRTGQKVNILEASTLLVKLYRQFQEMDSAFYFEDLTTAMKDSLYGPEKFKQLQLLMLDRQEKQQQTEQKQEQYKNNIKYTLLFLSLGIFLLISFILFRANQQKQKAKTKIEKAYIELKETQALLIQREKMASLGELTAGIAHEIQNPLNFVNNFSEINKELLEEIEEVRRKKLEDSPPGGPGRTGDERAETEMIATVKENEQKISHHGKRADAIVKSMLQHARASNADTGQKQLTDINQLADEYLRMAYQGYRSKDKDFNCDLQLDLDPKLPLVSVVAQDIGRVFLNLFNNAFWFSSVALAKEESFSSVALASSSRNPPEDRPSSRSRTEDRSSSRNRPEDRPSSRSRTEDRSSSRSRTEDRPSAHAEGRKAGAVNLSTINLGDKIEIRIRDNGPGIPQHVIDKIFQPFYTTKPTGQGTGLGLSLAYEIVKAHGGELRVVTEVGVGSEFIIELPVV